MTVTDPNLFTVIQLKEFLRIKKLSAKGTKTELIKRLSDTDPYFWEKLDDPLTSNGVPIQ